jgi:hypothetical protein
MKYGRETGAAFVVIEADGMDIEKLPLLERNERLANIFKMPRDGVVYGGRGNNE